MSVCMVIKAIFLFVLAGSLLICGCGKKSANTDAGKPEVQTPTVTPLDTYLAKQDVNCEANQACPNYITKIIVVNGDNYNVCTGFLTDDNMIATSTSCLPSLLRQRGQDCSKDVFFFFPKTWNREAERVGCAEVVQASDLDGLDPVLWRDDVSFLAPDKNLKHRRPAVITRDGVQNRKSYTAWMVDQQDDFSAIVKKVNCEAVHNNYVNPLVLNESSPNMLFADCPMTKGATGAPIIDNRGKVRSMVSMGMDKKLRDYLASTGLLGPQGLKEMFHATNFACAATPYDTNTLDERECRKDLTYAEIDRVRSEMLSTNMLFGDLRRKYEASLETASKYVRFGVKLIPKGDIQETEIYPKCFKPLKDWLETLNSTRNVYVDEADLAIKSFRRTMDPYARVLGSTDEKPTKHFYVQFSLKSLRSNQKSSVIMWAKGEDVRNYPAALEECPATTSLP